MKPKPVPKKIDDNKEFKDFMVQCMTQLGQLTSEMVALKEIIIDSPKKSGKKEEQSEEVAVEEVPETHEIAEIEEEEKKDEDSPIFKVESVAVTEEASTEEVETADIAREEALVEEPELDDG